VLNEIMFHVPAMFEAGLKSGELIRVGGLLKSAASGQIVTHLQESSVLHSLISQTALAGLSPATTAVSSLLNAGTGIYNTVQIGQLKTLVEGLQALQVATLGVSLVGVGVSVAGFIYMRKRFNQLDSRIDSLTNTVNIGFEKQRMESIRSHLSQVHGLMDLAFQAPTLSKPEKEYTRIAEMMASESSYFEGELKFVIKIHGNINQELFWQLAQTFILCNNVRIDCRIRTNEMRNALKVAESIGEKYQSLFDDLTPISFENNSTEISTLTTALKDITDTAASKPYLIDYLHSQRIDGREYIAHLENEKKNPLLMLKVT
jgi:hypothetical protein